MTAVINWRYITSCCIWFLFYLQHQWYVLTDIMKYDYTKDGSDATHTQDYLYCLTHPNSCKNWIVSWVIVQKILIRLFFYQFLTRSIFYSYIYVMISVSNKSTVRHLNTRTAVVDEALGGIFFLFLLKYHMYKNNTKLQHNSCYVFFVTMTFMCSNCSVCILSRYMKSVCMFCCRDLESHSET